MAPNIPSSKITLSYPLYAAAIHPHDDSRLLVGGGGGEGRSGVGNKITLLDATSQTEISNLAEIELSRDEDSVTSLAATSIGESLVAFAGINSSSEEQKAGKNEHLRSFIVTLPAKEKSDGSNKASISAVEGGRTSLFTPSTAATKETYQRVIRVSRPHPSTTPTSLPRLGAVATGLAPKGQIIVFNASTTTPHESDVCGRITLAEKQEAADLDILETSSDGDYSLAYCTDHEVYLYKFSYNPNTKKAEPIFSKPLFLHELLHPDAFSSPARPTFRALRFLTPTLLVVLLNRPGRSGSEVHVLHIAGRAAGCGDVVLRKRLHSSMKAATGLDVSVLQSDDINGDKQFVIAAAGQDISIEILTLDYKGDAKGGEGKLGKLNVFTVLREVHPLQMTSIALSTFSRSAAPSQPPHIRLVSVSMGNTAVVHTLPLIPLPPPSKPSTKTKTPTNRYVLTSPQTSTTVATISSTLLLTLLVLLAAFLTQNLFVEPSTSKLPPLPAPLQSVLDSYRPYLPHLPLSFPTWPAPAESTSPSVSPSADADTAPTDTLHEAVVTPTTVDPDTGTYGTAPSPGPTDMDDEAEPEPVSEPELNPDVDPTATKLDTDTESEIQGEGGGEAGAHGDAQSNAADPAPPIPAPLDGTAEAT
ncbi:MAG: hypothetical protein M1819_007091 [Sarea resinae]|nr:MAG: hypothetical protein M1819_007091 [Sarea resinae]